MSAQYTTALAPIGFSLYLPAKGALPQSCHVSRPTPHQSRDPLLPYPSDRTADRVAGSPGLAPRRCVRGQRGGCRPHGEHAPGSPLGRVEAGLTRSQLRPGGWVRSPASPAVKRRANRHAEWGGTTPHTASQLAHFSPSQWEDCRSHPEKRDLALRRPPQSLPHEPLRSITVARFTLLAHQCLSVLTPTERTTAMHRSGALSTRIG